MLLLLPVNTVLWWLVSLLPITRALSSGFSVGASLSGKNLFNILTHDCAASHSPSCPALGGLCNQNQIMYMAH